MIKFIGGNENDPIIGLGLSFKNLKKLKQGQPILIDLVELGLVGNILIFSGSTEQIMEGQLKEFITDKTKINIDPRLKQ